MKNKVLVVEQISLQDSRGTKRFQNSFENSSYVRSESLHLAVSDGYLGLVSTSSKGIDVNETNDGTTPLYIASQQGHLGVVKVLLAKKDIDVNQATRGGYTPLWIASQEGHGVVKALLVAKDIDVNKARTDSGETPFR